MQETGKTGIGLGAIGAQSSDGEAALLMRLAPAEAGRPSRIGENVVWFTKAVASRLAITAVTSILWLLLICTVVTWLVTASSPFDSAGAVLEGFGILAWTLLKPVVVFAGVVLVVAVHIGWLNGWIPLGDMARAVGRATAAAIRKALRAALGDRLYAVVSDWRRNYTHNGFSGLLIAAIAGGGLVQMFTPQMRGGKVLEPSWISDHMWGWVFVPFLAALIVLGLVAMLQSLWALLCLLTGMEHRWADQAFRPYGVHHYDVDSARSDMQAARAARKQHLQKVV